MSRICPLCGGNVFEDWQFGLFRCRQCNLIEDEAVWRPAANEQLNEASFGDSYNPVRSFWVRMFETLNNRRTINRLRRDGGGDCWRLAWEVALFWHMQIRMVIFHSDAIFRLVFVAESSKTQG